MIRSRKLILALLGAAAFAFPSVAQANFCGVAGSSAQEIAANVVKTKQFKRYGGNARFVSYFNQKAVLTLLVTKPGNKAYPAVACRRVTRKSGDWEAWHTIKCEASRDACRAFFAEFKVHDVQWQKKAPQ
jgi:hypothetical protein